MIHKKQERELNEPCGRFLGPVVSVVVIPGTQGLVAAIVAAE